MQYQFQTRGVCSRMIEIEIDDREGVVTRIDFKGGCQGNLSGLGQLAVGMKPEEVAERLKGIACGSKGTSCPDQLATALAEILSAQKS